MIIETWSDLPEAVRVALFKVQDWSGANRHKSSSANAAYVYLLALNDSIMAYGTRGAKTQLLYIVNNLGGWRGDEARATKKTINDFIASIGVIA